MHPGTLCLPCLFADSWSSDWTLGCLQDVLLKSCRPPHTGRDHLDIAYTIMANMLKIDKEGIVYTYLVEHVRPSPCYLA